MNCCKTRLAKLLSDRDALSLSVVCYLIQLKFKTAANVNFTFSFIILLLHNKITCMYFNQISASKKKQGNVRSAFFIIGLVFTIYLTLIFIIKTTLKLAYSKKIELNYDCTDADDLNICLNVSVASMVSIMQSPREHGRCKISELNKIIFKWYAIRSRFVTIM